MKKILWKRITLLFKNRRIGDFVCNFTAVVLGIILTFMGSDWIEKRNTQRDVKSALHLVKAELQTNRETILGGKQRVEREIRAAQFLLRNKDSLLVVSKDSLEYYSNMPFQTSFITFTTIKSADVLYTTYQTLKKERNDCLDAKPEVKRIYAQKLSFALLWSRLLAIDEGYDLLVQIPNMINPESFDYFIKEIDSTIQAIEKYE